MSNVQVMSIPFNPILIRIDLRAVSFFHFAKVLHCNLGVSVFEPLKKRQSPLPYRELFKELDVSEDQYSVMNNRYIEFARYIILKNNGYVPDEDGFYKRNGVIPDIRRELTDILFRL